MTEPGADNDTRLGKFVKRTRDSDDHPWPSEEATIAYALGRKTEDEASVLEALARSETYRRHMLDLREEAEGTHAPAFRVIRRGSHFWRNWAFVASAAAAVLALLDARAVLTPRVPQSPASPRPTELPAPPVAPGGIAEIGSTGELHATIRAGENLAVISLPDSGSALLLQVPALLGVGPGSEVLASLADDKGRTVSETTVTNGTLTRGDGTGGLLILDPARYLLSGRRYVLRLRSLATEAPPSVNEYPFLVTKR